MTSFDGGPGRTGPPLSPSAQEGAGVAALLFESLVHQLIEKGVLTKNDALSIVQTVSQVTRGRVDDEAPDDSISAELAVLRRLYESFEALRDRTRVAQYDNVRHLRPPLHGDVPEFPVED